MIKRSFFFFASLIFFMHNTTAQKTKAAFMQWNIAGELPATPGFNKAPGLAGPVAGVHQDVLIIAGGANFPDEMPWIGGKKKYYDDVYVAGRNRDSLENFRQFKLPWTIAYSATCSTPFGIISAGGENETGLLDKVFMIKWDAKAGMPGIEHLPPLPFAVANAGVAYYNNKIFVAGGETATAGSVNFLWLDLKDHKSGWKPLPSLPKPVSHMVMVVLQDEDNSSIYVIGGRSKNPGSISDLYASTLQFDLKKGQWVNSKSLPFALSAGTGIALDSRNIVLFGGDSGETFHKTEKFIVSISEETDSVKKKILVEAKAALQSAHPGFCGQVLLYNADKDKWKEIGCIPFDAPVTTTAILWNGDIIIPSGEIKAGVRTPFILIGKF